MSIIYLNHIKLLRTIAIVFLVACFTLSFPNKLFAATGILKQINFQGKVVNANGTNVTNGDYSFLFCIYTVASPATACTVAANNDAIWRESKTLTVTDGIFRTSLGDTTALPGSVDFNTDNIYMGTNFNSDGQMTPLVRFTAVPYAFNALKVAGLTVTDTTGTFTLAAAKTLTVNNTLTFAGTDATTVTFQGTDTYVGRATTDTLTNKTIGTTGLTFSGATTDITTATGEDLTLVANGAGALKLGDFTTENAIIYTADGTTDGTMASIPNGTTGQCLVSTTGLAPAWGSCSGAASVRWDQILAPTADLSLNHVEWTTAFTFDTPTTAAAKDYFTFASLNDATTDSTTQRLLVLNNNDDAISTGATESLLVIDNKDANEAVTNAILIANSGGGAFTNYINAPNFSVTNAGALVAVGINSGTGLLQGMGGLTLSGSTNINTSGSNATNIGTGTNGGTITIGNASTGDLALNDAQWSITGAGAATFATVNGNTITTGTGILTIAAAKTLTASNTLTLAGTDGSTLNIGAGGTLGSNAFTSTAYAPLASPIFTGTVTIPTPFTLGATSVTSTGTQLNYLNAATGTTGTTSTNVVFSTSPTLTTPILGAATATSVGFGTNNLSLTGTTISTSGNNADLTLAPNGTGDLIHALGDAGQFSINATPTTDVAGQDSVKITLNPTITGSTQVLRGLVISQSDNANTGVYDSLAFIENLKTPETTTNGLLIEQNAASGTLTNGLQVLSTAGALTNGLLIADGAGTTTNGIQLTGTFATALFDSPTLDITAAGNITGVAASITGAGALTLTPAAAQGLTLGTTGGGNTTSITLATDSTGDAEVVLPGQSVSAGEILNDTITATQLAATVTFVDNDFLDLAAIVHNDTANQGLRLPNAASATPSSPTSGEGYLAWDTAGNQLITYNGAAWATVGGGGGYNLIKDETTGLTARTTLAFLGTAVTCADNAGLTQTECTISGAGGGVSFASGVADNTATGNNLIHLQKSGLDKFVVANSGGLTITAGTSDTVKTTTGTTLTTDFSITGSTLTNVASSNDLISINDGSVTNTMSTSTVVTAAAAGAGSHTILREDGMYIIIHGNSLATGSRWDGSSTTMTSVTVATGAVNPGAGSVALKRPDGRYLIVHGNASAGLTSLFDPRGVTAIAAGPAVCGAGAATTGTNAFLRQDGKYVILCGNLTAWGVYDPTANTYTAGTAVGTAFGAGAHAVARDDGTFLVFRGGGFTSHWIYNPFASATGTMTADPITSNAPTISTGAFSIRRADGKYLVIGGAINTSSIYDPTRTSANSGAGTMTAQSGIGFGPTAALGDGAQSLWRQDGRYLLIAGGATTTTNVIDPSKTDSTQFVAGPALNANAAAGIHAIMRPDGAYQIIRGGATTTTDIYNTGFIIGGSGAGNQLASYETECITATSLNATSTLKWSGNSEGRMWFQVKTGNGACSGSYKDIKNSGDLINPVAGDNRAQIKVFFQRDLPKFADQEWGIRRGLGQTRYRRTNKDPALYDVTVDNSTSYHRSQFEFGNSSDPSGPVMVNLTNNSDRNLAIALEMGVGYGSTINATNPQFYNGAFGTHTALATSATAGTVVMKRPDGKFMLVAGNTTTANAQLYDPVGQTFTAQSGAGNIPTAGSGLGALAIKRPNGTYLMLIGNATTTTNVYDPLGVSGSQFVAGPALTAAAGRGAIAIPLPNGRVLIMHGNFTTTSSIYDPIQNAMVAGPISSAVIGGGSMAIPRPNGTYFVVLGVATEACTALNTVTNNFDPYTMIFTATGSPAITTGVGPGAFTFQRSDGQWVIVHGGGTASTCAGTTRTQIYNPIANTSVVGPVLSGVAQHGAHAIQKPDGTWLVVHGGALTTTSTYLEKKGAFTAEGLSNIGQFIAGPALVTAASAGSISFQRDDGKFVTINGNAGTVTMQYDGGWISNGTYRSEAINIADLDSSSALVWQANADLTNISVEVRTATSKDNLQVATFREIPTSGGLINPGGSETWVNVNFNFKRSFPSYGGIYTDTWYNGGSPIQFAQRKIVIPTLNEFKITKDVDLINLKSDGLSVFRVNSDGDIYTSSYGSVNTGGADLAENYTSQVHLEKGEVVAIDPQNNHGVKRTSYQYQPDILGIVSTEPGFVAGSYTKDSYPIALIGRVPVKVSTENGLIRVGDYITASSVPGYAMKATKAGRVLGKALETIDSATLIECPLSDFQIPGRKCGTVMVFVNLTDYLGAPAELMMEESKRGVILSNSEESLANGGLTSSLDPSATPQDDNATKQDQILTFLKQLKEERETSGSQYVSEVYTDRVSAVNEIITPHVITELLTAKKIKADSIEGLEILTDKISSLQGQVAGLSVQSKDATSSAGLSTSEVSLEHLPGGVAPAAHLKGGFVTFESGKFTLDLTVLGKLTSDGGLVVGGPAQFKGETFFEKLVTFVSNVIFRGKVTFEEVPTFNKDTAGSAIIIKDTDQVIIVFEKEYEQMPFVTVGITLDTASKNFADKSDEEKTQAQEKLENDLFSYDLKYFATKRDSKGFTIKLNKKAPIDVPFNWHAIAVKDSIVFKSKLPVIEATSAPLPTVEPTIEPSISASREATESAQ